ncbi:unnamed protein product [Boreogadus saida]
MQMSSDTGPLTLLHYTTPVEVPLTSGPLTASSTLPHDSHEGPFTVGIITPAVNSSCVKQLTPRLKAIRSSPHSVGMRS